MFVALDCAGLQPFLIESLLWGHGGLGSSERTGTIYLKEPASMPRDLQQRFLDEFVDEAKSPRLICGSVHTPAEDEKAGKLLSEFASRLAVLELRVPPLRERAAEMPQLVSRLIPRPIDAAAIAVLKAHDWPGNVRELIGALSDAVAAAGAGPIQGGHLPRQLRERFGVPRPPDEKPIALDAVLESIEKRLIQSAMARANGNATKAAEMLGIWRTRLLRRIEALGLASRGPSARG
jgi:DNA-binding NtrC family response regulator